MHAYTTVLCLTLILQNACAGENKLHDNSLYSIKGKDAISILKEDSGWAYSDHMNIEIYNIGRSDVYGTFRYGTKFGWIGDILGRPVKSGERQTFDSLGRVYYVTGMLVHNQDSQRAIIKAAYVQGPGPGPGVTPIKINWNNVLRYMVVGGVKFIPKVGSTVSAVVGAFWPEQKTSVWDQIKDKITTMVDSKVQSAITGLLEGDIAQYKVKLKTLSEEMDKKNNTAQHYMQIAKELIGFERKFMFSSSHVDYKTINHILLPLYSNVVHMKMMFYKIGVDEADKIGLSSGDVQDIVNYSDKLLHDNGAVEYIHHLYNEQLQNAYDTADVGGIFDAMMGVRGYVAVNGFEYLPIWERMLIHPEPKDALYNDVIAYSLFHGRQTAELARFGIMEEKPQPLTPKLLPDGKRNKLKSVVVHMWRIYHYEGPPRIGGMEVIFESGETYMMGFKSEERHYIEWNGAQLVKLTVTGTGALDRLTFEFSDGRVLTYGTDERYPVTTVFELPNHHIVGMFVSNDFKMTGKQANNIAVSYQLNDLYDPKVNMYDSPPKEDNFIEHVNPNVL